MKKLLRRLFPDKEIRAFRKMHRRHRRELIKHAKETGEWDWCWLHDSIIMQIRHMYEFYTEQNNVWQCDESRLRTIEQLQHILDINAEIECLENDNYGTEYIHKDGMVKCIFPDDFKERFERHEKREQELYEELYGSIGKHIRLWWD